MKVYVVLADAMGGIQYCGAFRVRSNADQQLAQGVLGKNPRVVELDVASEQTQPNVLYVAQTYNRSMDVYDFEGVYCDYDSALQASGRDGQTLSVAL